MHMYIVIRKHAYYISILVQGTETQLTLALIERGFYYLKNTPGPQEQLKLRTTDFSKFITYFGLYFPGLFLSVLASHKKLICSQIWDIRLFSMYGKRGTYFQSRATDHSR